MICRSCLLKSSSLRPLSRAFSYTSNFLSAAAPQTPSPRSTGPAATASPGIAQPFSTPLSPTPISLLKEAAGSKTEKNASLPISACVAGTPMKGINYLKGRDDPVALKEEEYPEWLWRCLDEKVKEEEEGGKTGDEFSKSKKLRRKAAKAQRKLEAKILASGDLAALQPKVPITKQSIDLPVREGGVEAALEAGAERERLTEAMRRERRAGIKESNFLKGM